jgi:hypothetical protein
MTSPECLSTTNGCPYSPRRAQWAKNNSLRRTTHNAHRVPGSRVKPIELYLNLQFTQCHLRFRACEQSPHVLSDGCAVASLKLGFGGSVFNVRPEQSARDSTADGSTAAENSTDDIAIGMITSSSDGGDLQCARQRTVEPLQ